MDARHKKRVELIAQAIRLLGEASRLDDPPRSVNSGTNVIKVWQVRGAYGYSVVLDAGDSQIDLSGILDLGYDDATELQRLLMKFISKLASPTPSDG